MNNWELFLQEGKVEFEKRFDLKSEQVHRKNDFQFIRTIGEGSFGRVYLARLQTSKQYYAIKVMDKMKIFKHAQVLHTIYEKKILQSLNFPFCVYLEMSWKDNSYLYLSLPFVEGGELFTLLRAMKRFEEGMAKFYGAQILLAIEYLHFLDLVYRDLKPENILIDRNGYLKLTDFGFCKVVKTRTYTLCGTPEYLAPEMIMQKGYSKSVDWWTYGVLLYEMVAGCVPFAAKETIKIYQKVLSGRYYKPKFFSKELAHLVQNLLQFDLTRRLGCLKDGVKDVKEHPWFSNMEWQKLFNGHLDAPFVPEIKGNGNADNFDRFREIRMEVAIKDYFVKDFQDF